jgi:hypothetical protein
MSKDQADKQEDFLKFPDEESYGPGLTQTPKILLANYGLVILYNILAWRIGGCHPIAMIVHYHVALGIFYLWHWQAHTKFSWNQECFRLHMAHHWQKYPPSKFFGDKPESYETVSTILGTAGFQHELGLYVGVVTSLICSKLIFRASWTTLIWATIGYALVGYIGNYLHNSFHIPEHPLNQFRWFHELRALHYIHHLGNAKHNYAIVNFTLDKLAGHYFVTDPPAPKGPPSLKRQVSSEHYEILQQVPAGIDKGVVLGALIANESPAPPLTRQLSAGLMRQLSAGPLQRSKPE